MRNEDAATRELEAKVAASAADSAARTPRLMLRGHVRYSIHCVRCIGTHRDRNDRECVGDLRLEPAPLGSSSEHRLPHIVVQNSVSLEALVCCGCPSTDDYHTIITIIATELSVANRRATATSTSLRFQRSVRPRPLSKSPTAMSLSGSVRRVTRRNFSKQDENVRTETGIIQNTVSSSNRKRAGSLRPFTLLQYEESMLCADPAAESLKTKQGAAEQHKCHAAVWDRYMRN
jgi:hypothetical protein